MSSAKIIGADAIAGGGSDRLAVALAAADETKALEIGEGVLAKVPELLARHFGATAPAMVIADANTFEAAGRVVDAALRAAGVRCAPAFVFGPDVYADYPHAEQLEAALRAAEDGGLPGLVPVAVGSGTVNDLAKLAARLCGRSYLTVATAASVDGYTSFGASLTRDGFKQTFTCPAPRAVLADVAVMAKAPPELAAAGYADLLAKVVAGADWLVTGALGVDPLDGTAWRIVQGGLRDALADPAGVAAGDHEALHRLTEGLMLGGFAMQRTKTSRPAAGAEHQFSHLWDMQHHTYNGAAPSHGFKVGVATLAVTALYEWLLERWNPAELDVDTAVAAWPATVEEAGGRAPVPGASGEESRGWTPELAALARRELAAKWVPREVFRAQLERLRTAWPDLSERLRAQLLPFAEMQRRLRAVGAPDEPERIGISRGRLRVSFIQAQVIRSRFTVLDLAVRAGVLRAALAELFGPGGRLAGPSTHSND